MDLYATKRPISEGAEKILGLYFPVLDYGFVSLVDYMSSDVGIEQSARVSYGAGTRQVSKTRGLIRYLKRHLHTSPFEQVELKFHMCLPIFVARQIVRHRTSSLNEYSGRYSLMPMLFYTPELEQFQKQSKGNNQGRKGDIDEALYLRVVNRWNKIREENQQLYIDMTKEEVARELARIDLPLSTYTQWYWKIDLHNLMHFLTLRVDEHAQWETREYAKVMAGMMQAVAPLAYEAWIDYNLCGQHFSREEMKVIREITKACSRPVEAILAQDDIDLNKRELDEFRQKLVIDPNNVPDFALNISQAKSADYFEQLMKKVVPHRDENVGED